MAIASLLANRAHHSSLPETAAISIMAGLLAVLDMRGNHAYEGGGSLLQIRETERILRGSVHSVMYLVPMLFALAPEISKEAIVVAPFTVAGFLMVQKRCFFFALRRLNRQEDGATRVVVYGRGAAERRVISALFRSVRLGLTPVAVIDDSPEATNRNVLELGYRSRNSISVHAGAISPEFLIACGCNTLVIVSDNLSSEERVIAAKCARLAGARVAVLSDPNLPDDPWMHSKPIDGLSIKLDGELDTSRCMYESSKRLLDIVLASIALLMLSPVFLLIAMLIRLDSPGPAFFIQDRVGLNGRLFKIYKFRSMYEGSSRYEVSPTTSRDPRLTRVGRILRRLSLDELPQFLNVILGSMSLVGPRPEMPFIAQNYSSLERKRLQAMPGITGLWQLSADRAFPIHENLDYDLYYIRHRGMFMDLAILIHTAVFAMTGGV